MAMSFMKKESQTIEKNWKAGNKQFWASTGKTKRWKIKWRNTRVNNISKLNLWERDLEEEKRPF